MAIATNKYTTAATSSGMKSTVTMATDTTDLTAGIEVTVFVAKSATNKDGIIGALGAIIQKLTEEPSP